MASGGKFHNILKSYFNERQQFVCLETLIMNSPKCGVVQVSKMSGTRYNFYVNEVPDLHKLMYDKIFKNIIGKDTKYKYKNT